MEVTQDLVREILHYDSETGIFTWKSRKRSGGVALGSVAGTIKDGYIRIKILNKAYRAHRLAWLYVHGEWPSSRLDHKNGIKNDNRLDNLRLCTHAENIWNSKIPITNTSGYKGVCFNIGHKKWQASVTVKGKRLNLGYFDDPSTAHQAYVSAAKSHFGDFARTE